MKKTLQILFLIFLVTFSNKILLAEGFNSIHTSDGNFIIAAGDQGLTFRSANGGNTWAAYSEPSVNFKSVYTSGTKVWLSGDNGKIYLSSATSPALTPVTTGITTSINSIYFIDANTGFFCGDNGVLYKSVDGGTSWTSSSSGISNVKLNTVSFYNTSVGVAAGADGNVFVTDNGGSSWTSENISSTRNILNAKYLNDGIILAGEWGTLIYKNNGGSWSSINTKTNSDIRGISGTALNNIHICGGGGFIRNNTSGSSSYLNFEKNPMLADLVDIVYSGNKGFAVSRLNNAIIRTLDNGATWSLPSGTSVSYVWEAKPGASGNFLGNNLCLHPTDRNAVFIAFADQVYRSGNKGDAWTSIGSTIPSGNTPHSFFVSPIDTNIWMVAIQSSPDKVYRTSNYGATWTEVLSMNFSNYGQPLEMDQNDPHVFYFAPDNGGFYKSTDDGATFNEISGNYPFRSPCDILVKWDNSDVIFLADGITGSGQAKLFKSINKGVNWTLVHTASASEIPSMCSNRFAPETIWCTEWSGSNIYKSTDGGDTWNTNHSNSFSGWGSDICHEDPNMMITGSWSNKATLSLDKGLTWTDISSGLGGHGGGILIPEKGYILAHQGSNIYKLNISYSVLTGISENTVSSIASDYSLAQNYPNPFNPSTKISYSIPQSGNVSITIFNELGKEVITLVNGFKNAGSYEINFNASDLSSGIYFYRIQSGNYADTKKMLLVK